MKHGIISAAILSGLFISPALLAETTPTGTLQIKGQIAGASCAIQSGDSDKTLQLPLVGADQFTTLDIGQVYTAASAQSTIGIVCSGYEGDSLTLSFNNDHMNEKGVIAPTGGSATGIGFQLEVNGELVNSYTSAHTIVGDSSGNYVLPITAYYHKMGEVTPGDVASTVTYTITHD